MTKFTACDDYYDARQHAADTGKKIWNTVIATKFLRKRFKGRGYGNRIADRLDETLQAACVRWIRSGGRLSPATCCIFEDRRLAAREARWGQVASFSVLSEEHLDEVLTLATVQDMIEGDASLIPSLEIILDYSSDSQERELMMLLAEGWDKSAIADHLGISRPTLYKRIKTCRERLVERMGEILSDDLNQVA